MLDQIYSFVVGIGEGIFGALEQITINMTHCARMLGLTHLCVFAIKDGDAELGGKELAEVTVNAEFVNHKISRS